MRQELTRHAFWNKGRCIVVKYTAHQASKYEVPQGTTKKPTRECEHNQARQGKLPP